MQRFKSSELKLTIEEYLTLIILFNFSEKYKGFYKGRLKIERLFSIFKTRIYMNVATLHSTKALYTRIYRTLVSWQLLKLIFLTIK